MPRKLTNDDFKKQIYELVGDEYIFQDMYVNNSTKINVKHNIPDCAYIYPVKPNAFKNGNRCPKCAGTQVTHEDFVLNIFNKVGDEYIVLGKYINSLTKIELKHNIADCGNIYTVTPKSFVRGARCAKCAKKGKRRTQEEFVNEVYELVGDEYKVLGIYETVMKKILFEHNISSCNYRYEVSPNDFLNKGRRCPKCFRAFKKTQEEFINEVYELVGDEYRVLGNYDGNKKKVEMIHNIEGCRYIFKTKPNGFLSGSRCPQCFGTPKKTQEEYEKEVYELVGNEYRVIGRYLGADKKIEMLHNIEKCGYRYEVKPYHFLHNRRCPRCKNSKGEKIILDILNKYNIRHTPQYSMDECVNKETLPFDCAIFNNKKELIFLIEYDGIQHYKPIEYFCGKEGFKIRKEIDKIKTDYCRENQIQLIRIPYFKIDKITQILLKKLVRNNLL